MSPGKKSRKPREMCQREGDGYVDRELWAKMLGEPDLVDEPELPQDDVRKESQR